MHHICDLDKNKASSNVENSNLSNYCHEQIEAEMMQKRGMLNGWAIMNFHFSQAWVYFAPSFACLACE